MKAKKEKNKTIDFDDFASKYENYLSDSFGKIDNNVSYYHKAKIKILKKELNIAPKKILDFGCGIGLMLGHLKDNFIDSQLYAYDDSLKSLDYVKSKYPDINCINNLNHNLKFDLIFISNVIHHVKSFEREQLFNKIYNMLDDQGKLFIFEHNPYNPITLKVVANCEFDLNAELIKKIHVYLPQHNTEGLDIRIMSPVEATRFSLERVKDGLDTISVTGNVLRDYLTDLFPILEVGTSAKMLSIVPLLNGGGLFETGAGGSAPKHVQQLAEEGHLRWDSLGEFCALSASLEFLGSKKNNPKASILANTLDQAVELLLDNDNSPSRKVGEIDNRGSHFYIAKYWSQALADQDEVEQLKSHFQEIATQLTLHEKKIINELLTAQGTSVDLGGYYHADKDKIRRAMRPSPTLNNIIG